MLTENKKLLDRFEASLILQYEPFVAAKLGRNGMVSHDYEAGLQVGRVLIWKAWRTWNPARAGLHTYIVNYCTWGLWRAVRKQETYHDPEQVLNEFGYEVGLNEQIATRHSLESPVSDQSVLNYKELPVSKTAQTIAKLFSEGWTQKSLMEKFGMTKSDISCGICELREYYSKKRRTK